MVIPLYLYFQVITAVLSLIYFYKHKNRYRFVNLLTVRLLVSVIIEVLGKNIKPNFIYYHFYMIFDFLIIYLIYQTLIKDKLGLLICKILLIVFFVFWGLIFFDSNCFPYAQIVGSINVGVLVFLYFKELLQSNEIIDYKKLLPFWVSIGFVVFYLGSIPFFALWNYFKTQGRGLFYILHVLIVLMNVFISIGFIIKIIEVHKSARIKLEEDND